MCSSDYKIWNENPKNCLFSLEKQDLIFRLEHKVYLYKNFDKGFYFDKMVTLCVLNDRHETHCVVENWDGVSSRRCGPSLCQDRKGDNTKLQQNGLLCEEKRVKYKERKSYSELHSSEMEIISSAKKTSKS